MPKTNKLQSGYDPSRYKNGRRFVRFLMNVLFPVLAKIDRVEGTENLPETGAAIVYYNHFSFADPMTIMHVLKRDVVPMAKIEVYDYPVVGILPKLWYVVPVRRGEADRRAIRDSFDVLRAGEVLLIAPEGTRGPVLRRGLEGSAYLASRTGALMVPAAICNSEGFPTPRYNKRWRGPGIQVRFGRPFRYRPELQRAKPAQLRRMTDEAMYILAAMLPEEKRGAYSDLSKATQETIEWVK